MTKPKIICHMVMSLDGRIDCSMVEKIETDDYYEALNSFACDSTIEGRTTVQMHYANPTPFSESGKAVGRECFYKAAEGGYQIFVDTRGTLTYPEASEENRLCLLGEQAKDSYLKYLEGIGCSYIVCGKDRIDFHRAVEILAEDFGVKRLAVVGGGRLNAAFLKAGLLDVISVMISPGIDGREGEPALFDGLEKSEVPVKIKPIGCKMMRHGTLWVQYTPESSSKNS